MIKRTLYFGNPAYLNTKNEQLVISVQGKDEKQSAICSQTKNNACSLSDRDLAI